MTSERDVLHLYWRAGMGLGPAELTERAGRERRELVDELIAGSANWAPLHVEHAVMGREEYRKAGTRERSVFRRSNWQASHKLNLLWMRQLAGTRGCLREKMALFWHGHFACWSHWSISTEQYLNLLREHALGNFGDLLKGVCRSPAMLEFLNKGNRKRAPNENLGREVMELFTLGRGNYTEQDVKEAARAFTGWDYDMRTATFLLDRPQHDDGPKTFFGRTGNFDGDDILDIILDRPQVATFICTKLYRHLVDPEVDAPFVGSMAERFRASGYDIGDLVRFVLLSDHFHDGKHFGARVKSPVELLAGLDHLFNLRFADERTPLFLQRALGQELLLPPNVSGWTEHTGWIDSNSLMLRLRLPSALINQGVLDWEDDETSAQMDLMPDATSAPPLRDNRGRVLHCAPDKDAFLAQLPPSLTNDELRKMLLTAMPSDKLQALITSNDPLERTIEVLSSPEYQLC